MSCTTIIDKERVNQAHMANGVTLIDPANTYIGAEVTIGTGTVIYPGCFIDGATKIGENCFLGPNCRLTDTTLANGVTAEFSVIVESEIGEKTTVGPFAYVRPNSKIGTNCRIGDFVEIKNAVIGNGSKVSHLTYVGDADVGNDVNFGCGTVTVNYDGTRKARTTVEDGAFIGCNTNLIAPVTVKAGAYTAAGSTITTDVPEDALAVARTRQENKLGWRRKKRG